MWVALTGSESACRVGGIDRESACCVVGIDRKLTGSQRSQPVVRKAFAGSSQGVSLSCEWH